MEGKNPIQASDVLQNIFHAERFSSVSRFSGAEILHLAKVGAVADAVDSLIRKGLPKDGGEKVQVVAENDIRTEPVNRFAYRRNKGFLQCFELFCGEPGVTSGRIRHPVRHAQNREVQVSRQRGFPRSRIIYRMEGDPIWKTDDIGMVDSGNNGLPVSLTIQSPNHFGQIGAAAGGVRFLGCNAQNIH